MITPLRFLTISEPCHEGWETMDVSEKGRFCSSCQKEVHDFSNSSAAEIRAEFEKNSGELCGHVPTTFLRDQYIELEILKIYQSYSKKFLIALLFCFGANLFSVDAARASTLYKLKLSFINMAASKDTIVVKGIIKERKSNETLPFVNVTAIYNDSVVAAAVTDLDGAYQLKIPSKYEKVDIKAVYIGYEPHIMKGVKIAPDKQVIVDMSLEGSEIMLDGIMIYEEPLIKDEPGPSGKTIKREEFKRMPK